MDEEQNKVIEAIKKFKGEYDKDITFDEFSLREMMLKIPSLKSKWTAYLSIHETELEYLKRERGELIKFLSSKIKKESDRPMTDNLCENLAKKSEKYIKLNNKIKDMELLCAYLSRVYSNMQSITWEMKNINDDSKMEKF